MTHTDQDRGGDPEVGLLFGVDDLHAVRALVRRRARLAGLSDEAADDLVLAVHEVAACAFAVDARPAVLAIGRRTDRVVCEIREADTVPVPGADATGELAGYPGGATALPATGLPAAPSAALPTAPSGAGACAASRLTDPAVGPGRGWRIARALCDEVQGATDGTGVRMSMLLLPAVAEPSAGAPHDLSDAGE